MGKRSDRNGKPIGYMSLADYANLPPEPTEPYTSSPWEFDPKAYSLDCYEKIPDGRRLIYSVPLAQCLSDQGKWGWLSYLHWTGASDHVIASLVHDLCLFLGERESGPPDVRAIVRKRMAWAEVLRGKRPVGSKSPTL